MANTDNAVGFQPVSRVAKTGEYTIASGYGTALRRGDAVELTGTSRNIQKAAAENVDNLGVFGWVEYIDSQGNYVNSEYWPASTVATNIKAHVWDDPHEVFRIQCDTLAATDEGALADWDAGTPSATGRCSGTELVASVTGTSGKSIRIIQLSETQDNAYGAHALADVKFAEHIYLTGAAGAGGV
jgi:hypothetical protein